MKLLFQEARLAENLYRLVLDNALDAFVATDEEGRLVEWSAQAERTFGWSRQEALGRSLAEILIPERFHALHFADLSSLRTHGGAAPSRRLTTFVRRKDGSEIPIDVTITPIALAERRILFASMRDISDQAALQEAVFRQAGLTGSILDGMSAAVVVANPAGRVLVANPAAQRLLGLRSLDDMPEQDFRQVPLYTDDGAHRLPAEQMPMAHALRGEHVDGFVARIQPESQAEPTWGIANARPLRDSKGNLIGGVVVWHDITEQRRRAGALTQQARQLQEQASLLDLAHDAILVRTADDVITYWNHSAQRLYGYTRAEALGQVSHALLQTRFPLPLAEIQAAIQESGYWEGELQHTAKDGRVLTVFSEWTLEWVQGKPHRYLETNSDITQQKETERALRRTQEDFRRLVESLTDYAVIVLDAEGKVASWNVGAERILGYPAREVIGMHCERLFAGEDRSHGEPWRELDEARTKGRAEDERWHVRRDGSRFWASGVVTPLWNEDQTLRGYVKIMRDQTEQRLATEQTQFLANHDGLTGLPNRVHFSNQLHAAIAQSERSKIPLAVLLLDLDRFKQVNDTFGHHTGDLLLKEVAQRIVSSIRETDFVARLGGDEFVVIQRDVAQPHAAETLARKLIQALGRPYYLENQEIISGTSVGISFYPRDARSSVELLKRADLALYRAKHAGRHTYQVYSSELFTEQTWRRDREAALRGALSKHQFELYYQPQIDLGHWKIATVEALLRWKATELELVLPNDFLDLAEETGLIVDIGNWALREACRQVHRWQELGLSELRLSLNCSARQFNDPRFVAHIPAVLAEAGMAPRLLELEVPEIMLARHPEIKEQLAELRRLGIRITIDNFGTGATALADFKDFEFDALKIDKAFVQHLPHRREDSAITSAIISLAHNLGIGVVAGGVETAEQLAYLKARDCTGAQGFIFSPPVPPAELEAMMLNGAWSQMNRVPGVPPDELH